jgi:hypothetical protein
MSSGFPCWLSGRDAAIAKALIEKAGFCYIGSIDDFCVYDEELGTGYKLAKCHGWQLASAYGEVGLEAVKDGAIFAKCLEVLPNIDFEAEVRLAKQVIRGAVRDWEQNYVSNFQQLSLSLL